MSQLILTVCFYLLFFLTPLVWTPINYELFEYNKMIFVYLLTIIVTGAWVYKMVNRKSLIVNRTPLDIPILLFLAANIFSTISSIDPHTSLYGYYSRSNGGLFSIISYIILYYALVSNFDFPQVKKFLYSLVLGGLIVSLYAIPEHFGISPSCVILTNQFSANCWVQDVQARVFATLGQPNWFAAYMAMLIFPTMYFLLTAKSLGFRITYYILLITFYLSFTFTYSRGASLGLIAGIATFMSFWLVQNHSSLTFLNRFWSLRQPADPQNNKGQWKVLLAILAGFVIINIVFGSAYTRFKLITEAPQVQKPSLATNITQLENGGTESSQIRLIVWRGAVDIFKHYPIFGSGVETFAYAYYSFRPVEHNLVSEWDFLYNKAHNEYLNYLATTGILGFLSYMAIIITFILWSIKYIVFSTNKNSQTTNHKLLTASLLASYISYLVQNFFGFSVVVIALLFFLFPAVSFLANDSVKPLILPKQFSIFNHLITATLYRRGFYKIILLFFLTLIFVYFGFVVVKNWLADTYFGSGTNYSNVGNAGRAYNELINAVALNPNEPFYRSELGFAAAAASVALEGDDATLSAQLKNEGVLETEKALTISPNNVSFWRTAVRTYYQLASSDPLYNDKTLQALDKAIVLAPTDAKLYYNKGLIFGQLEKTEEGIKALEKAIQLKPNYRDAHFALGVFYETLGQIDKAKTEMEIVLKLIPNDPEAVKKLQELK